MRDHRHGQRLTDLVGIEIEHAGDRAGRPERGQVGVVPAARRGRERVVGGGHHLVADRDRGKEPLARHVRPLGGRDDARDHVARMPAVALADEKIVVVVAAQQHPVGERRDLRRALAHRAPDHATAVAAREPVGVAARRLRGRMGERPHGDCERIGQHSLGGAHGRGVERTRDVRRIDRDQGGDFVLLIGERAGHGNFVIPGRGRLAREPGIHTPGWWSSISGSRLQPAPG